MVNPLGGGEEGGRKVYLYCTTASGAKIFFVELFAVSEKIISMSQNFRETQFFLFFAKRFRFVCGVKEEDAK